jgi:hypothetical protein
MLSIAMRLCWGQNNHLGMNIFKQYHLRIEPFLNDNKTKYATLALDSDALDFYWSDSQSALEQVVSWVVDRINRSVVSNNRLTCLIGRY